MRNRVIGRRRTGLEGKSARLPPAWIRTRPARANGALRAEGDASAGRARRGSDRRIREDAPLPQAICQPLADEEIRLPFLGERRCTIVGTQRQDRLAQVDHLHLTGVVIHPQAGIRVGKRSALNGEDIGETKDGREARLLFDLEIEIDPFGATRSVNARRPRAQLRNQASEPREVFFAETHECPDVGATRQDAGSRPRVASALHRDRNRGSGARLTRYAFPEAGAWACSAI